MRALLFKAFTGHFVEEELRFLWESQVGFLVHLVFVLGGQVPCLSFIKRCEGLQSWGTTVWRSRCRELPPACVGVCSAICQSLQGETRLVDWKCSSCILSAEFLQSHFCFPGFSAVLCLFVCDPWVPFVQTLRAFPPALLS